MKSLISLALILLLSQMTFAANSNSQKVNKSSPSRATSAKKSQLGTSFRFDGTSLRGKYSSSMNTAATVENDKLLEDLLKGRTQFEDRAGQESERN